MLSAEVIRFSWAWTPDRKIAGTLSRAGFKSRVVSDIRAHIWLKLWGNLSFNPISTLTGATMLQIAKLPETRALVERMMEEAQQVRRSSGSRFR